MKDKEKSDTKNDWRNWLADLLGLKPEDRDALLNMLGTLRGNFVTTSEKKMISGVLRMRDLRIRDVMEPHGNVSFIPIGATYRQAVEVARATHHSRYPVLDENGEQVCGILLAKDLLDYVDKPQEFSVAGVLRETMYAPDTKPLDRLLNDFLKSRSHMVIVRDEHTRVAGIITIEDVLEKIVGEIEDETDDSEDRPIITMDNGEMNVKATLSVAEFNHTFDAELPLVADSIAGWLAATLGHMPQPGETCEAHGFVFRVITADASRVHRVSVRRMSA